MDRDKYEKYQSDVIVDLLQQYGIKHIAMNPGASFRGLHDSVINYGANDPELMVCQHEEIAVQIAHGYARATGKPMGVILHNLVGMLHAQMAVYYAYIDRAPIFIMGATGPMHEGKRRPHIDWSHSALVQGEAMRNYTKWDYQPHAIEVSQRALCEHTAHGYRASGSYLHVLRRLASGGKADLRGPRDAPGEYAKGPRTNGRRS